MHLKQKTTYRNRLLLKFIVIAGLLLTSVAVQSQCAMCRASLESEGNVAKAEAVNDGIVYLMVIPYVLVAIIGFIIYKMFFKKKITSGK